MFFLVFHIIRYYYYCYCKINIFFLYRNYKSFFKKKRPEIRKEIIMDFICEKYLLLVAILTASHAAAPKSPVQVLEGLLIEAGDESVKISGYDLKTGIVTMIPAEIESTGGVVLNAKLFSEIIRKAPGQYVKISVNSGFVAKISSELSEYEILGFSPADYPELPIVDEGYSIEISEALLKKMISQTGFAVSDNESRPIQTGALFETGGGELTIVAVDGFRLALRREPLEDSSAQALSFVVPGTALDELSKIISDGDGVVSITLGTKYIMFTLGDTMLVSRRLEGEFLNYKNTIPLSSKYQLKVEKDELISALERVSIVLSDKIKGPIRAQFCDGIIKMTAASALGKASDECIMAGDAEELEMGFNDKYMIEVLKAVPADEINLKLSSSITPCIISPVDESNRFLYMILPVRLRAYES